MENVNLFVEPLRWLLELHRCQTCQSCSKLLETVVSHSPRKPGAVGVSEPPRSSLAAGRSEGCSERSRNLGPSGYDGKQRRDTPLNSFSPEVDAKTMYVVGSDLLFPKLVPSELEEGNEQGHHRASHRGLASASCGGELGLSGPFVLGPARDFLPSAAARRWLPPGPPCWSA